LYEKNEQNQKFWLSRETPVYMVHLICNIMDAMGVDALWAKLEEQLESWISESNTPREA